MTSEHFALIRDNKTEKVAESLNIDKSKARIIHYSDGNLFQGLSLYKETAYEFTYLSYDRVVNGLWARLVIYPSSPSASLKVFYLGTVRESGDVHGVIFTNGDPILKYYFIDPEKGPMKRSLKSLPNVNWVDYKTSKKIEYSKAVKGSCKDPQTNEFSFAVKIIPAPYGPIAQVSTTEDFKAENTLLLDTSLSLSSRSVDYVISEARILFGKDKILEKKAPQFCDDLQKIFAPFFPIDLKNR